MRYSRMFRIQSCLADEDQLKDILEEKDLGSLELRILKFWVSRYGSEIL